MYSGDYGGRYYFFNAVVMLFPMPQAARKIKENKENFLRLHLSH